MVEADGIEVVVPRGVQVVSWGSLFALVGVLFTLLTYMHAEQEASSIERERIAAVEQVALDMNRRVTANEEYFKESLAIAREERREMRASMESIRETVERLHME